MTFILLPNVYQGLLFFGHGIEGYSVKRMPRLEKLRSGDRDLDVDPGSGIIPESLPRVNQSILVAKPFSRKISKRETQPVIPCRIPLSLSMVIRSYMTRIAPRR